MKSISTQNKKGFTLIELLVVITIIGILATWAVATYASQMQKARDSVRMTDINTLRSWIEQFYNDDGAYPTFDTTWFWTNWVWKYVERLPTDAKTWQACNKWSLTNWTPCDYLYAVKADTNTVARQNYNLSTWFENSWNVSARALDAKDAWVMPNRLEIWVWLSTFEKLKDGITTSWSWTSCVSKYDWATTTWYFMLIKWNCN